MYLCCCRWQTFIVHCTPCVWEHTVLVHSSTYGQLGWLHLLAIMSNASINNLVQFLEWALQDHGQKLRRQINRADADAPSPWAIMPPSTALQGMLTHHRDQQHLVTIGLGSFCFILFHLDTTQEILLSFLTEKIIRQACNPSYPRGFDRRIKSSGPLGTREQVQGYPTLLSEVLYENKMWKQSWTEMLM